MIFYNAGAEPWHVCGSEGELLRYIKLKHSYRRPTLKQLLQKVRAARITNLAMCSFFDGPT